MFHAERPANGIARADTFANLAKCAALWRSDVGQPMYERYRVGGAGRYAYAAAIAALYVDNGQGWRRMVHVRIVRASSGYGCEISRCTGTNAPRQRRIRCGRRV